MANTNTFPDILSLDEVTLEPPESRVGSVAAVRDRITELKEGDDLRSKHRAIVQGLINGNKPYLQEEMDNAGRGDDANINLREAEGDVAAATTPYYELAFGVPRAANIEIYFKGADKQKNYEWGEAISNRFSEVLWGWKGYKINLQLVHYQMVVYGRGPIMWDTKRGWHFKAKRDDSVWVADNAMCDLDLLEEMVLAGHFDPVQLWKKIDKETIQEDSDGRKNGWLVKMAKKAIIKAAPKILKDTYHDAWSQYEASLRRGDSLWGNKASRIYYKDYLIKEFTGKITHCIVLDSNPMSDTEDYSEDDFLYQKTGKYESFHRIICPFFFDIGPDAQWYSVKGLGPKIFDFRDLSNRFMCTMINGAMASCGIPLQAKNGQAMQKIQETPVFRASGINFIPPDWDALEVRIQAQLEGPLNVKKLIDLTLEDNIGQYRQRGSEANPQPTLGQEQLSVTNQTTLTRGAYDRHYHYMDDMLEEILRRMLDPDISEKDSGGEEALEIRRKLIEEDEIPEEVLDFKYICSVKAVRNVGYGSPQNQMVVGQQLMQLLGTMPEDGRNHTLRMIISNLVGHSQVDRFMPKFENMGIPNDQEALAIIENNILRMPNGKLVVTPLQNPTIHFTEHFKDSLSHVQEVKGGQGDPQMLVVHLDNAGPHMHKHLDALKDDPTKKNEYKQFVKMQMMLGKIADQVKKQVAKTQKGQKPQSNIDPKMIEGLLKLQGELKLKEIKLTSDEARKDKKLEGDMRRKDQSTAANIYRRNAETLTPAA